ncbi:MAG: polysaccharide deacetylase family protein [Chloroherpetonaceae bacterium]|nr:polysaccharide deacetylase family protein [Chloroherpetonaceae bacterium]
MNSIFTYHKITDRLDFGICTRKIDDFKHDISWISSLPHNERPRIIFDDGYEDTFHTAFPILEKAGLTATIYVIGGMIGKLNTWDADFLGNFRHINDTELKSLFKAGWKIGSHGFSHRALTALSSERVKEELKKSKDELEQLLGIKVNEISFPFGNFNQRVLELTKEAGFESAISISRSSSDGFVKRSLAVYRTDTINHLIKKAAGIPQELIRLRMINAFSELTVWMHRLEDFRDRFKHPKKIQNIIRNDRRE